MLGAIAGMIALFVGAGVVAPSVAVEPAVACEHRTHTPPEDAETGDAD
jgi:hypothetical protein